MSDAIAYTTPFTVDIATDTVNGIKLNSIERGLILLVTVREDINDTTLEAHVPLADLANPDYSELMLGLRHNVDSVGGVLTFEAFSAKRFTRRLVRLVRLADPTQVDTDRLTEVFRRARNTVHHQLKSAEFLATLDSLDL